MQNSNKRLLRAVCLLLVVGQLASASGIFELNLSSLTDLYGRDLRLDCCAWQNNSSNSLGGYSSRNGALLAAAATASSSLNNLASGAGAALAEQQCDPTKCQLIVRICVKNYQNQIDASQCTFGELSAQVMKPNEPLHYMPSLVRQQNVRRGHQQPAAAAAAAAATGRSQQEQYTSHQQRMMLLQQQHQQLSSSILSSGQSRSMRTIAFDQPISFPFNFTWPVSSVLESAAHVSVASDTRTI